MNKDSKIFIAGAKGLVGSSVIRALQKANYNNLLMPSHSELDLLDNNAVESFFKHSKPDYVFLAAAKVGGIHANSTYPADFVVQNLRIQLNIIESAHKYNVKKLMFLGSSCIYPKFAKQPMQETELLGGYLEPTNKAYAIAKIAGIITCQSFNKQFGTNYISVMPTNLYGLNDNYHPENSHVIPGMIRKFHEAKISNKTEVILWGTGSPKREFLYADDLAEACLFLMQNYNDDEIINIGSNTEVTIRELAEEIKKVVDFQGQLIFDSSKPDGSPRKLMDSNKLFNLGWRPKIGLNEGLKLAYQDFLKKNK